MVKKVEDPFLQILETYEHLSSSDPFFELWHSAWVSPAEDAVQKTVHDAAVQRAKDGLLIKVQDDDNYNTLSIPPKLIGPDKPKLILIVKEYERLLEDMNAWFEQGRISRTGNRKENASPWDNGEEVDEDENEDDLDENMGSDDTLNMVEDENIRTGDEKYFLVVGSPGIGKTMSLYYILTHRLLKGLPTFFQRKQEETIYFCEDGVFAFNISEVSTRRRRDAARQINQHLLLLDSNDVQVRPNSYWIDDMSIQIVEASSPRSERIEWVYKQSQHHVFWIMRPMSPSEFCLARRCHYDDFNHNENTARIEQQLQTFYDVYGPSLRDGFACCIKDENLKTYEARLQTTINNLNCGLFRKHVSNMDSLIMEREISPTFLLVTAGSMRNSFRADFVSREVYERIKKRLGDDWNAQKGDMLANFLLGTATRSCAGYLLEDALHSRLVRGAGFEARRLRMKSKRKDACTWTTDLTSEPAHLAFGVRSDELITQSRGKLPCDGFRQQERFLASDTDLRANAYCFPSSPAQATFNAYVFSPSVRTVWILQYTVSAAHSVKRQGLEWITTRPSFQGCDLVYVAFSTNETITISFPKEVSAKELWHVYLPDSAASLFS